MITHKTEQCTIFYSALISSFIIPSICTEEASFFFNLNLRHVLHTKKVQLFSGHKLLPAGFPLMSGL